MNRSITPEVIVREINVLDSLNISLDSTSFKGTLMQEGIASGARAMKNMAIGIVALINTNNEVLDELNKNPKSSTALKNYITGVNGTLVGILNGTCDAIDVDKYLINKENE